MGGFALAVEAVRCFLGLFVSRKCLRQSQTVSIVERNVQELLILFGGAPSSPGAFWGTENKAGSGAHLQLIIKTSFFLASIFLFLVQCNICETNTPERKH